MKKGGKGLGGIMGKDGKRGSIKGWKKVRIKGGKREGLTVTQKGKC